MYGGHVKESARTAAAAAEAQKARERTTAAAEMAREQAAKSAAEDRIAQQAEAARQESDRKAAEARAAALKEAEARKEATKDAPSENSLGMKFVRVPGTDVLFSMWHTRVRDYAVFAKETAASISSPNFPQTPNDPVVHVSWEDAQAFCKWLTEKERSEGKIGKDDAYRLPTDAEWSAAVGATKFPWGNEWPPPKGVGNYAPSQGVDSFEYTSPVCSFPANRLGLYDMGGNVWQWCEDWYRADMNEAALLEFYGFLKNDGGGRTYRVLRGASWYNSGPVGLWSSYRSYGLPDFRNINYGFRCVLGSSR
jgi:formylglycine-generating enzyme required for sulfatase activity